MKIEIEKWVRIRSGGFDQVEDLDLSKRDFIAKGKLGYIYFDEVVKVKDTPEELIQIEDWVELESKSTNRRFKIEIRDMRPYHITGDHLEYDLRTHTITKIFTLTECGKIYTLQYSKEAE